ncbi:MAG: ATP-dependent DNA helicase [uncultured bacterium]|nr:MAG: ATP-dependent DNA helicase [uncultured bacterium]
MTKDKYSAVWVSHTSINDFLDCPRAYYLKNLYKDRSTGNKIQIITPSLSLGSAVHEVLEELSLVPTEKRFDESLVLKLDKVWENLSGKKGGFKNLDEEHKFKERGKAMLRRVMDHPGPLLNLAVKIKESLPFFWLSEEENIILCGKIDWLEYLKDEDGIHIIDFKTGKKEETGESLQLPIYHLLTTRCQTRPVSKASYWYLDFSDTLKEKDLPDIKTAEAKILELGRKIKLARKLEKFDCPNGKDGCLHCRPLEAVVRGEGERVGEMGRRDTYILKKEAVPEEDGSEDSFLI